MKTYDITPGMIVKLNSGGPDMTVSHVGPIPGEGMSYLPVVDRINVSWFDGEGNVHRTSFESYMLRACDNIGTQQ